MRLQYDWSSNGFFDAAHEGVKLPGLNELHALGLIEVAAGSVFEASFPFVNKCLQPPSG